MRGCRIMAMTRSTFWLLLAQSFLLINLPQQEGQTPAKRIASEGSSGQIVFEMVTTHWGIGNDYCGEKRVLNLRLYSDGRVEYERCQEKSPPQSGHALTKRETRVDKERVEELTKLIEESGFLRTIGPAHSGLNGTDVGWNMMLKYSGRGGQHSLEVRNYVPESEMISPWLHQLIAKAEAMIPKGADQ